MKVPKNVKKLVTALRSGKYTQTQEHLRRGDSFCCLGVACDISKLGKWEKDEEGDYLYLENEGTLPPDVITWLGPFWTNSGFTTTTFVNEFGHEVHSVSLMHENDINRTSFEEIADMIEWFYLYALEENNVKP